MIKFSRFAVALLPFLFSAHSIAQPHSLNTGWNLVGNDSGAGVDTNTVFGNASVTTLLSPNVTTIWTWDNTNSKWNFFAPSMTPAQLANYATSKQYGVLSTIQPGEGFWVNAKNSFSAELSPQLSTTAAIAQAKTMFTSLRSNATLLSNASNTGFLQTQATGLQTDMSAVQGAFSGLGDFVAALNKGISLLDTSTGSPATPAGSTLYATAQGGQCMVKTTTQAICQWTDYGMGGSVYHQLTVSNSTIGQSPWNWSEVLVTSLTLPNAATPVSGVIAQTGTANLSVSGQMGSDGSTATGTLNGNALPIFGSSTSDNHTALALTMGLSFAVSGLNKLTTVTMNGSISEVSSNGTTLASMTLQPGTNTVSSKLVAGDHPVSGHFIGQFKTLNYQFDGTLDGGNFAQNNNSNVIGFNNGFNNWYPKTGSFTGNISGINNNSLLGQFMTGTLNMTENRDNYNPAIQPSSTNYLVTTATFSGSIVNRTLSPAQTYTINFSMASNSPNYNSNSMNLTYTDPGNNTVTVDLAGGNGIQNTGTLTMGGVTVIIHANGNDSVYSGTPAAVSSGSATLIGTTGNAGMVNFIDGSTVSVK